MAQMSKVGMNFLKFADFSQVRGLFQNLGHLQPPPALSYLAPSCQEEVCGEVRCEGVNSDQLYL